MKSEFKFFIDVYQLKEIAFGLTSDELSFDMYYLGYFENDVFKLICVTANPLRACSVLVNRRSSDQDVGIVREYFAFRTCLNISKL